ncbi:hypothetical protein H8784_15245 [Parabacteroides acidifaciens]|uniref:Transglutaminase domain-containing protein n=1 Tax=Parabacteroides acidifaciens TaxID=2290935 RepID=A0A3D8HC16_9BACT|nr:hypothetical protein [Parabacteroides acidifaciens]MBC8603070.1 hypothetical protein [Parabacteroides acidifaciens]RDU48192.1 hypothetical protein DWU89_15620 [Parabacteroides acidifaciens]
MNTKILICLIVLFSACSFNKDKQIEYALDLAGENRPELERVLLHYQDEPEKLAAARFLIRNMPRWYGYEGPLLDSIRPVLVQGARNLFIPKVDVAKWQGVSFYSSVRKTDVQTMTACYLIENIDLAFEVYRKYSWNRNLPFGEFCELILPYRIGDEPLTAWRRMYYERYVPLLDSLYPNGTDVVEACRILAGELKKESYYYNTDFSLPRLGGEFLLDNRIGYCRESCDITTYAMRACGIPVAIDFYSYSPEYQQGHMWSVVRDTTGRFLPFWYTQFEASREMKDDGRKKGKVYRYCFGIQPEPIAGITVATAVPSFFKNRFIRDVTNNYSGTNEVPVPLWKNREPLAYLGVFNRGEWIPIDIAKNEGGEVIFRNVEPDNIYMPVGKDGHELVPVGDPFILVKDSLRFLRPDTTRLDIVRLVRKMPLMPLFRNIQKDLIGGRFEAACRRDFKDAILLYEITDTLQSNLIEVVPLHQGQFRYMRYVAPPDYRLELAELAIYSDRDAVQPIELLPLPEMMPVYNPEDLTDGNILTYINLRDSSCAIGFDMGKLTSVGKISFSPRNDDNFVWAGDEYELFYFSGIEGWKSLGKQTAKGRELYYRVPHNSLLWLRNLTKGKEEQVFFAENGEQVFGHEINYRY